MYIIDRIEENYERAMINTPAERLSEYILMNLESVPEMTLTRLAYESDVSKGFVNKYISMLTGMGSYAAFQSTLREEINCSAADHDIIMREAGETAAKLTGTDPVSPQDIRMITREIMRAERTWIVGRRAYEGGMTFLIRSLRTEGIYVKYLTGAYLSAFPSETDWIGRNDVVIILSPGTTVDEFQQKTTQTFDLLEALKNRKVIFVGKDEGSSGMMSVVKTECGKGPYEEHNTAEWLALRLMEEIHRMR